MIRLNRRDPQGTLRILIIGCSPVGALGYHYYGEA